MKGRIDRRVAFATCWLALLPACGGCRNCDAVEAELRIREQQNQALHAKLRQTELNNMLLQRELFEQRTIVAPTPGPGAWKLPPEVSGTSAGVQKITLGRLTGGHATNSGGGDDALQVVVEPRDVAGRVFKAAGDLQIVAQEITAEGTKRPLGTWEMPADQLATKWRSGLFGGGYDLTLAWKDWPTSPRLRVIARFTSDGKTLEAERDITVRLGARSIGPAEKLPEPQGPILSRVFSFFQKDRPPGEAGKSNPPAATVETAQPEVRQVSAPAPTWQPAERLPPVRTQLLGPVPIIENP
jgi:hypothetical protein